MRHIINGCSIDVTQLTDRELDSLIINNQHRLALLNSELHILVDEHVRRLPIVVPPLLSIHSTPTLF